MRSTLSPRCYAEVTCFTARGATCSLAWSTVRRAVGQAQRTRVDGDDRRDRPGPDGGLCHCFAPPASPRSSCWSRRSRVSWSRIRRSAQRSIEFLHRAHRHPRRLRARPSRTGSRTACSRSSSSRSPVELQYELTRGELRSFRRKAIQPAIAAAGGVVVPIAVYLAIAGGKRRGSGVAGPDRHRHRLRARGARRLRPGSARGLRVFLLALAILDDIVGIVFIAVLFATDVNIGMLALALLAVVAFAILSRVLDTRARPFDRGRCWCSSRSRPGCSFSHRGCTPPSRACCWGSRWRRARRCVVRHAIEPWVNVVVLPVFAFSAALVADPAGGGIRAVAGVLGHPGRPPGRQDRRHRRRRLGGAAVRRRAAATRSWRSATSSPPGRSAASGSRSRCCWPTSRSKAIRSCATRRSSVCSRDRSSRSCSPRALVSWRARHHRRLAAATASEVPA